MESVRVAVAAVTTRIKEDGMKVIAVRAFIDGRRKKTDQLTKQEARAVRIAARYLSRYLTKTYKLGR